MANPDVTESLNLLTIALDGAVPSHIRQLLEKGALPNFRKLMARGTNLTDCRPPFPSITPTCWSTFGTGATPATHGATCQDMHLPGMAAGETTSAYHSSHLQAERFWEAAARVGKTSLVMQLPASGPVRSEGVFQIAGAGCGAVQAARPDLPSNKIYQSIPAQFIDSNRAEDSFAWSQAGPTSGQWQPKEEMARSPRIGETRLPSDGGVNHHARVVCAPEPYQPFAWEFELMDEAIRLETEDGNLVVKCGEWSPAFRRTILLQSGEPRFCHFRIRLFMACPATRQLKLFITQSGTPSDFASPENFAQKLDSIPLVPATTGHSVLLSDPQTRDAFLEAEKHSMEWQLAAFDQGCLVGKPNLAIVYAVFLDTINHAFRNVIEGLETRGEKETAEIASFYDNAYVLADWFVGELLARSNNETTILVLSDHGSVGYKDLFDPFLVLEQAGLLTSLTDRKGQKSVDVQQSKVIPVSSCHVYVNLASRYPEGTVSDSEYDSVVNQTIHALQSARSPEGAVPVAFALRRDEAGLVGLGGERCGDVVYGLRGSYTGGHIGGIHACQTSTARTDTGDIRSLCLLAGPGIRQGGTYGGPVWLWDLAPTLAHLVGFPAPENAEGRVIRQILA